MTDAPAALKLLDRADRLVHWIDDGEMLSSGLQHENARKIYEDMRGLARGIMQRCKEIVIGIDEWLADPEPPNQAKAA